ncbi:MAG: substrate-binding domain-containing protein [Phycisphaerae bacterium]|nr:substrate-binding domain-containing protein [Phycisphaerae bacterium]
MLVLCVLLLLLPAGCDRPGGTNSASPRGRVRVALVGASESDPLWPVLRNGALRAQRDFGEVSIETFAPSVPSAEAQSELLRSLRDRDFLAVCVQVADPEALRPALEDVRSAGVFVITLVRPVSSSQAFHHCGPDEAEIGRALADALVESIDGTGTIAVLTGDGAADGVAGPRARVFRDRIREHADVHVLRELSDEGTPKQIWAATQGFCSRYPRLTALAMVSDDLLEDSTLWSAPLTPDSCKVFGVGPLPARWPLLANRWCHALVGAEYGEIGYKAVQWCIVVARKGELPPQAYAVPVRVVWCSGLDAWKAQWARWTEPIVPEEP